jgi:hypothetical protein
MGWFSAFLLAGICGLSEQPLDPAAFTTVHLRVFTHASVDAPTWELAKTTAGQLLASAGIVPEWRNCDAADGACRQPGVAMQVIVLLLPVVKMARADVSAEVVRDPLARTATMFVYLPNLAESVRTVRQSTAARSDPSLATLQLGHLVGLAIAHEVGHAFGLPHARSGVMKARLATNDFLALRASRFAFTSKNTSALRQTLMARARQDAADGR